MKHIDIDIVEIAGLAGALTALRLPFGLEARSSIRNNFDGEYYETSDLYYWTSLTNIDIDSKDMKLMSTLVKRGDEHAKVIRGIIVYAKITAPLYFWSEMETYRAGHERLASNSTMHQDCKGLTGEELVKAKEEIPSGKMLTKVDFFSYQCLRTIVRQRTGHRLPHWSEFIEWVKTLPFANELILAGLGDGNSQG